MFSLDWIVLNWIELDWIGLDWIGSPGPVGCWPPDRQGRQSPGRCRCDPRGPPPLHAPPGISCDHHDWHSTPLAAYLKVQDIPLVDKNS